MKKQIVTVAASLVCGSIIAAKPNVVVILADDIGTGDISHYRRMHPGKVKVETPNIDKLAKAGLTFTTAHSPAALCATSRYAIMTGNHCYRSPTPWGTWSSFAKSPIEKDQMTLGKLMKKAGYQTSFFGKWHMGGTYRRESDPSKMFVLKKRKKKLIWDVDISEIVDGGPSYNGFDYSFTYPAGIQHAPYAAYENSKWYPLGKDSKFTMIKQVDMTPLGVKMDKDDGPGDSNWHPEMMGPILVNKAIDYIEKNAKKDKPFFMYYCSQAVHLPHNPPKELNGIKIKGTTATPHLDMVHELDVQVGEIVKTLKKQGVLDNTLIIFTSDNGGLGKSKKAGHKTSNVYNGTKGNILEGGHRVPFIAWMPGEVKKGQSDAAILGLDIMATLAEFTGTEIPEGLGLDSANLWPLLRVEKNAEAHDFLMIQGGTRKKATIIEDGWKLILQYNKKDKTNKDRKMLALYNLNDDIREKKNLIKNPEYKSKANKLFKKYNEARDSGKSAGLHQ